jgi:predicted 2-oxoglutarate/Fe(II)-dependent dioxygenase YbiX
MAAPAPLLAIGDPMPRVTLPEISGATFDSWHQSSAGRIRVYWLDTPPAGDGARQLADAISACDGELRVVVSAANGAAVDGSLVDAGGELAKAIAAGEPVAVVVDAGDRLAAVLPRPSADAVAAMVRRIHAESEPAIVRAQAPVLLVERAIDSDLCRRLIEHWSRNEKIADGVASTGGASRADTNTKRRQDVPVNDIQLFTALRDSLVKRVMPAILQAFQVRIVQIELPRVGCYDSETGGWFRRHRDNTTPYTAHRQFAMSLNLNPTDEYEGGAVHFPEFGRQLYRPDAGGALVFSCSLLHEATPVTRGRRFGVFTFLHDESRDAQYRRMMAEAQARGMTGVQMR